METYEKLRRLSSNMITDTFLAVPSILESNAPSEEDFVVLNRVLPRHSGDNQLLRRFFVEANQSISLQHENIVSVSDIRELRGEYFTISEYVLCEDLNSIQTEAIRASQRIPVHLVCQMIQSLAKALDYASFREQPLYHSDLSPLQVHVTYDGRTQLADFGSARVLGPQRRSDPEFIAWSLPYCSPEQVGGQEESAQSNMFSLGVLFHELLSSKRLFGGASESAIRRNILDHYVPPPSVYNPDVDIKLDEIVLDLLQRTPDKRMSCSSLISRLNDFATSSSTPPLSLGDWMNITFQSHKLDRIAADKNLLDAIHSGRSDWSAQDLALPSRVLQRSQLESDGRLNRETGSLNDISNWGTGVSHVPVSALDGGSPRPVRKSAAKNIVAGLTVVTMTLLALLFFKIASGTQSSSSTVAKVVSMPSVTDPGTQQGTQTPSVLSPRLVGVEEQSGVVDTQDVVALELHVLPTGAIAGLEGKQETVVVRNSGALLAVPADTKITLIIQKDEFLTAAIDIVTPESGKIPVYVNLEPQNKLATTDKSSRRRSGHRNSSAAVQQDAERRQIRRQYGSLSLSFAPPTATVIVDGLERQVKNSFLRVELPPGPHSIDVSAAGYDKQIRRIQLSPKGSERIEMRLNKSLQVSEPLIATTSHIAPVQTVSKPKLAVTDQTNKQSKPKRLSAPGKGKEERLMVSASNLNARQTEGDARILPPNSIAMLIRRKNQKIVAVAKLCVNKAGRVSSTKLLKSTGYLLYDQEIERGIQSWKYRPFLSESGEAKAVCSSVTFVYQP